MLPDINIDLIMLCEGWVGGWFVWVELWVDIISHKTSDAIP